MQARNLTIRLIRLAMAAALLLPCLLFVYASWIGYRNATALADERLLRSLDVQREEALKTFQLIDLTLNNASDLVAGMSDDDIRHNEPLLYAEFKKFTSAISIVQSVWIYDKDGYAIVSSSAHPPPTQSYADRDFYQAHFRSDAGTYYGETNISQFNGKPFFTVSRRLNHDGAFAGVVEISVLPSNFFRFYSTLAYTKDCNTDCCAATAYSWRDIRRRRLRLPRRLARSPASIGPSRKIRKAGSIRRCRRSTASSDALRCAVTATRRCTSPPASPPPPSAANGSRRCRRT